MTTDQPAPVCGARAFLPTALVAGALKFETSTVRPAEAADVTRSLRCTLQAHDTGDHYGLVLELDGPATGAVWARWNSGEPPAELLVLPDCDGADGQPCNEYAHHPGAHSHQIHDPWSSFSSAL